MNVLFASLAEIPDEVLPFLYAGAALAILIFVAGVLHRAGVWLRGRAPGAAFGVQEASALGAGRIVWLSFTRFFAPDCLLARRVFANSRARGLMLSAIMWSVVLLAFGVAVSAVTSVTNLRLDATVVAVLGLAMDLAGGVLLLGLGLALARRFIFRPARYIPLRGDAAVMLLFFLVVLSGLVLESTHVAEIMALRETRNALAMLPPVLPPYHSGEGIAWYWQPFGFLIARLVFALGVDVNAFGNARLAVYLIHATSAFLLIAYLPFSKLFHIFAAQITTSARRQQPQRASYPLRSKIPFN